jgi:hypothetical protein
MGKEGSHDVLFPFCTQALYSALIIMNFGRTTSLELVSNEFGTDSGGNIPEQGALQHRRNLGPTIRSACIPLASEKDRSLARGKSTETGDFNVHNFGLNI